MLNKMKKAIFLDRDGVINKVIIRDGTISSPWKVEEFEFLPDVRQILENFKKLGFLNIIFTNQPDVKRGFLPIAELEKMHEALLKFLPVDEIKFCLHDNSDKCSCRKPKPGMILEASDKWDIDLEKSYVIGDSKKDIEAGIAAGCKTFLLKREYNKDVNRNYNFAVDNLKEAIKIINRINT